MIMATVFESRVLLLLAYRSGMFLIGLVAKDTG